MPDGSDSFEARDGDIDSWWRAPSILVDPEVIMRHQYKAHAQGYKPAHKPAHKLHKLAVRHSPILVLRIITCLLGTQTLWLWRVRSFQSWSRPSELGWYNDPKSAKVKIYMLILLLQYFFDSYRLYTSYACVIQGPGSTSGAVARWDFPFRFLHAHVSFCYPEKETLSLFAMFWMSYHYEYSYIILERIPLLDIQQWRMTAIILVINEI